MAAKKDGEEEGEEEDEKGKEMELKCEVANGQVGEKVV